MLHHARLAPLLALALLVGCSDSGKAAAEAAIGAAEKAIAPLKFEATRYAPKQLEMVEATLMKAREKLHDKDYQGAAALVGQVGTMVQAMSSSIEERKAGLMKEFQALATEAGQQVEAVRRRLDELAAAKKLPKGLDAGKVAAARQELAGASKALDAGSRKATEGSLGEAVAFLEQARAGAAELAKQLGQ